MGSKENNPISEEDIKKAQEALNSAKVLKENRWGIVDGEVKQFTDNLGNSISEDKKGQ